MTAPTYLSPTYLPTSIPDFPESMQCQCRGGRRPAGERAILATD